MIGQDITMLYVEDDASTIAMAKILFKKFENLSVTYASNGKEALKAYRQHGFDIVITDMQMPIMGGFSLIEKIREQNPKQPVAMVSAMEDTRDFIKAINMQIDYFVQKPIRSQTFVPVVEKMLKTIEDKRAAKESIALLGQYKKAVDESTILSKADLKGKITYANQKFCEISQYSKEELLGKPHSILRHPDMSKEVFANMWQTIQKGKTWQGRVKNLAKDGSTYVVDATIIPILDASGKISEYIALRADITELERYKDLLQLDLESKSMSLSQKVHMIREYEKALEESANFSRTDKRGKITYVNDKFCEVNGYSEEEVLGKPHSILRHPDMPKATFKNLWETIKAKKVWKGIIKNKTKSGDANYMNTTIVPILDTKGEIVEFMSIRFEVTDLIDLQKEIEDTQKEVVFTMGAIGESRSKETGNHVKRVAQYSYLLAREYGLSQKQAKMLKEASPMHDIGKVAIPDSILNKPGKLDAKEWKIMQTHAKLGYNMLKHSKRELLQTAAIVSYQHHEKYNGSGYPQGLAGEEIHIYGRITAIADVFDALGSDRCYKKAWDDEKIFDLFRQERAEHFDPKLVDIFFDKLDQFLAIRQKYKDAHGT